MPSRHVISRLVPALCGLALAGCYSPYRYAPYTPYPAGIPMYSPQAVPLQPQLGTPTPVSPDGTFPPAGSGFGPGTSGGTLTPTPDPNSGGTFPPSNGGGFSNPPYNGFDPTLPPPTGGTNSGLVPYPHGDPGTLPRSGGGNVFEGNTTPFNSDGASFQPDNSAESVSRVQFKPETVTRELQLTAHQTAPAEPATVSTATAEATPSLPAEPAPKRPNPYGYDAVGYAWLRGVVDFDESQKAWVLIYNPAPSERDLYKGHITLIDNGELKKLQNNQVVLVEGQVDATLCDMATGKPQYRVTKMYGPLVPKF
jgi:hypothetical protein